MSIDGARPAAATPAPGAAAGGAHPADADTRKAPAVARTPDGIVKLTRDPGNAILAGVAGGIAYHLRVPVIWVRAAFVLLAVLGGAGVLGYALLWIFVPQRAHSMSTLRSKEKWQAIGLAVVGVALGIGAAVSKLDGVTGWVLGPLGVVAVGAAFIWREADGRRRRVRAGMGTWWRIGIGIALVVGGLVVYAVARVDAGSGGSALAAVLLTVVGLGVITVPWWMRLVRALGEERRERAIAAERADIAAHLHDSVLQTLALIQRQAADPREVTRLARGQERELRTWLYGPSGYASGGGGVPGHQAPQTLSAALAAAAGEVEDTYAVAVSPVVVGDGPMNPGLAALVAAAREAMVNAAKHSGEATISVYLEVENGTATAFVRDRGAGFDPDAVPEDRRGVADSIKARMRRHGGSAMIRSTLGQGTEVVLTMPLDQERPTDVAGSQPPAEEAARS